MSRIVDEFLKSSGIKEGEIEDQTFLGWFKQNLYKRNFGATLNGELTQGQILDIIERQADGQIFFEVKTPRRVLPVYIPVFLDAIKKGAVILHD